PARWSWKNCNSSAGPADRQCENRAALQVQGSPGSVATRRQAQGRNATRTGIDVDAGILPEIWNRDLRAGGISEARRAAVPLEDVAKVAEHDQQRTTDGYDRTAC